MSAAAAWWPPSPTPTATCWGWFRTSKSRAQRRRDPGQAYLDSSAIVKLVVREAESAALRRYLRRRGPLVSSSLARTEVPRALLSAGDDAITAGRKVLSRLDLIRINNRVLGAAAALLPVEIPSLDAIHLATAGQLGEDLGVLVTYDERMAESAGSLGLRVVVPR